MCTVLNYISGSCLWPSTWFFDKHSSDHTCFCFSPYVMEDSCYFSCFLEIILVFVDVFLCLSWHSVLTLFLFCPTVLLVLFLFYGFSLPLIRSRRFLVDFHASFLLINQFSPLSHCLFWLFVFGYAFRTAYHLELTFWTTSAYTQHCLSICLISWCYSDILSLFALTSTVSLYNLDLSFVCQHFSMPLHVPQSLLCVGYCDCWFYSKIFMIPFVILIGFCWCSPHAYKLHFDDYFIVDFELSPDQAFSLDSMNVCYHLYWLNDGCVVLILISISFWIRGFVFSDFSFFNCHFWLWILWLWICLTGFILMLDNFSFCFVSSKLDWIFPSVSMIFLKIPDIFKVILDWICTSWIWMYSVVNLIGFSSRYLKFPAHEFELLFLIEFIPVLILLKK